MKIIYSEKEGIMDENSIEIIEEKADLNDEYYPFEEFMD